MKHSRESRSTVFIAMGKYVATRDQDGFNKFNEIRNIDKSAMRCL